MSKSSGSSMSACSLYDREISEDELAEHNTRDSMWIAVDGFVYDLTEFLDEHPGGLAIVMPHAGTDATAAFNKVGHSADARIRLDGYAIGVLKEKKVGCTCTIV